MKAFLFDTETGLYEGETFEDAAVLENVNGITSVPPPDYVHGQVPVFDRIKNQWSLVPVSIARQLLRLNNEPKSESTL